jgi:hypothetical protein
MTSPVQTLPEAPNGAAEYTPEQLAEMKAIPSRLYLECLGDGVKNPFYNARMDPGSDRWDAYTYFKNQPQVEVFVYPDPESPDLEVFSMSINGFSLRCYPNKRNRMPSDFAELLRGRNNRLDVYEREMVSRDEDVEGALTMTVGGGKVKPFIRRITD